jgi:hypothetical protein
MLGEKAWRGWSQWALETARGTETFPQTITASHTAVKRRPANQFWEPRLVASTVGSVDMPPRSVTAPNNAPELRPANQSGSPVS